MNAHSHMKSFVILLPVALCCLSGCFPYRYVDAPGVTGQVVDRTTKRPVSGAIVSMTSDKAVVQTRTGQSGGFALAAIQAWHLPVNYIEGHVTYGVLRVEAAGYRSVTSEEGESASLWHVSPDVTHYPTGRDDFERVRIALTPGA